MSKYSLEFKLEVVKYYLEEHYSYPECCKKGRAYLATLINVIFCQKK